MSTLNVKSSFSIEVNGQTISGQHGTSGESVDDPFAITVDGKVHHRSSQLATGARRTLWDEDVDDPDTFDYAFLWSDQDLDLQLIGSAGNVVIRVKAKVPFVLSYDDLLPAANTTVITAGATPSYEDMDSIVISNRSGSTANYTFFLVD